MAKTCLATSPEEIDWESATSYLLLNPRRPQTISMDLKAFPELPGHIWLQSSGSLSGQKIKLAALSKEALLISAHHVCDFVQIEKGQNYLLSLPFFHVGGLAVWARSFVRGFNVERFFCEKWDPRAFIQELEEKQIHWTSLVPTQLYDLCLLSKEAPSSLRGVFVGGGALSKVLFQKACDLKWPLLPTYGLTEGASQVAVLRTLQNFPWGEVLPHWQVQIREQEIFLKGPSLLTGFMEVSEEQCRYFPRNQEWWATGDIGELQGRQLKVKGRRKNLFKVGGEFVSEDDLNQILQNLLVERKRPLLARVIVTSSERLGYQVDLVLHSSLVSEKSWILSEWTKRTMPYEKIRHIYEIKSWPETSLRKVKSEDLKALLGIKG
ncbi:MAG: hypothetical protein D6797_09365 [Bdellovibrio sp.]|nr:MAG: hypothetical protein D6797_09365 [Bdellovibrio sp.]